MKKHLIALLAITASAFASEPRRVDATYTATIANIPAGVERLNVWIPLPVSRGPQIISDVTIDSPFQFAKKHEQEFGNDYAFAVIEHPPAGDLTVRVHFKAERREETMSALAETKATK